jgi:hypothetical protein
MYIFNNQVQGQDHDVLCALEIFPFANPQRIQNLLRSESLSTTLLILTTELTDGTPSDEIVGTILLTYATTYAQASPTDQLFLLTSLQEMFPKVSMERIESVLMHNSTHQAVGVLAEEESHHDIPKEENLFPHKSLNTLSPLPRQPRRHLTDFEDDSSRPNPRRSR